MDKVYVIYEGSVHEGGGVGFNAYTDKEEVRNVCKELVKDKQLIDNDIYWDVWEYEHIKPPVDKWEETEEDRWTNGLEEIKIIELEVN